MLDRILITGGIPSICSAHPAVIKEALISARDRIVLIESTCNQVNQYGGYTGMVPAKFVQYVQKIAAENQITPTKIVFGGDHLGPSVWQNEPADAAMQKAVGLIQSYVQAGFTKLHLDCSMRLLDDPAGPVHPELCAKRAAQLALAAEEIQAHQIDGVGTTKLSYVIGTEVPVPGGAMSHEEGVHVSRVDDVRETIEMHRQAFLGLGLHKAWERVIAVVVQPGVEFGDDFVLAYEPDKTIELSQYIEKNKLVYEAHSTDYQMKAALQNMVCDHFAILKVGPALTFAYREAIFALAMMENEIIPSADCSNIIQILDSVMIDQPNHWKKYYSGTAEEQAYKRKYSLSDRIRYYWLHPDIQSALAILLKNLSFKSIPFALASQFVPREAVVLYERSATLSPENIISTHLTHVLRNYWDACEPI